MVSNALEHSTFPPRRVVASRGDALLSPPCDRGPGGDRCRRGGAGNRQSASAAAVHSVSPGWHVRHRRTRWWRLTRPDGLPAGIAYRYTIKKNNAQTIASGALEFTDGKATIETSLSEPGMVYVEIDTITPPPGIWTAFNKIAGPKEYVAMVESDHNNLTPDSDDKKYFSFDNE